LDYRFGFFSLFLKINGFFTNEEEEEGWDVVSSADFWSRQRYQGC
jgi:hypothetical protein